MLDAVTFDLGGARPPLFVFPDASGLAPLTLPDEFLRGQSLQPPSEFPSDTVRRFETAMSTEQPLPPSVVESLMASVISGRPKAECPKVEVPTVENRKVEVVVKPVTDLVGTAPRAVRGGRGATALPDFATASVESQKPAVASIANPVPDASAERPMAVTVDTVVQEDSVDRPGDEKPIVAPSANAKTTAEPTVIVEKTPAKPVVRPAVVSVDKLVAENLKRTTVAPIEIPTVATIKVPTVEMVEAPVAVDKPIGASVEHSVRIAVGESEFVSASVTIPMDSMDRFADERPVVAPSDHAKTREGQLQNPVGTAPRAVRGGRGATALPSVQEILQPSQVIAKTPAEPNVIIEKTPVLSVDRPIVEIVDRPTVVTVEAPTVAVVEKPVAVAPSPISTVTPSPTPTLASVLAPTVPPVVLESPDDPVKVEGHPVAASDTPIMPDVPATRPDEMVEAPVAVDKPIGASVEHSVRVVVGKADFVSETVTIPVDTIDRSADERPVVAPSDHAKTREGQLQNPVGTAPRAVRGGRGATALPSVQEILQPSQVIAKTPAGPNVIIEKTPVLSVDRPIVEIIDRPTVVTVEAPTVAVVEKPVAVAPSPISTVAPSPTPTVAPVPAPTVVPVVLESPDDPVKVEEHPVVASSMPIAPVVEPIAIVETPAAVDKPIGVSVERLVSEAVEEPVVTPVNTTVSEGFVVRSADERPTVVTVERPVVVAPDKPTVVTVERPVVVAPDKPTVVTVESPVVVAPDMPTVVTVERPVVVAPDKPTVVTVERPVVVAPDQSTVATVEKPVTGVAPAAPTVAPVVLENPDDPVKEEGRPVAASSTLIIPDAPATRPDARIEAPVAVDKPVAASVEAVATTIDETVGTRVPRVRGGRGATALPDFAAVRSGHAGRVTLPSMQEVLQPSPVIATTPAEPTVVIEQTPVKPVERPVVASAEKPVGVSAERPVAAKVPNPTVATVEKPEEKAVAAAAHVVVAPTAVEVPVPQALQVVPEVAAASAASARTEAIVETVNQIVEAVVGQILVTPGITHGECEIKIMLKPTVLDGSEVILSAKDGTLTVGITPATQEASAAAAAALPRLEIALAEHAPAFHHVSVALQLKKGNRNEAV